MTEWPMLSLEEICAEGGGFVRTGPFGAQLHKSDYVDDPNGIPVVMPKNMVGGAIDLEKIARIDQATADRLSEHLLAAGDVALSRRGDVGRSAFIEEDDLPVLCGTGSMRVHLGEPRSVRPQFLRYFFRSRLASDYLEGHAVGATMPNLNATIVNAMPVRVPPIAVQEAIGQVLSTIDDLIENNRRRVEVLEEMARAIYREWFVYFRFPGHEDATFVDSDLGPLPDGWMVAISGDLQRREILDIGDGYRAKNAEMTDGADGLPFVRVANVQEGYLDLRSVDRLPSSYIERLKAKVSRPGDTVLCMKGTVGRMSRVSSSAPTMAYSPQVSYWRSLDKTAVPSCYLHEWLRSDVFTQQCAAVKGATDMADYVNLTDQRRMKFLLPNAMTMHGFDEAVAPLHQLADGLRAQSDRLASMRDLLLPKLVTGQIDVSNLDLAAVMEKAAV